MTCEVPQTEAPDRRNRKEKAPENVA